MLSLKQTNVRFLVTRQERSGNHRKYREVAVEIKIHIMRTHSHTHTQVYQKLSLYEMWVYGPDGGWGAKGSYLGRARSRRPIQAAVAL